MIRKVEREDIPECVKIIKSSFMTVSKEFGFTEKKRTVLYGICNHRRQAYLADG